MTNAGHASVAQGTAGRSPRSTMLFAPVGTGGGAIKINPALTMTEEALREGIAVLVEIMKGIK